MKHNEMSQLLDDEQPVSTIIAIIALNLLFSNQSRVIYVNSIETLEYFSNTTVSWFCYKSKSSILFLLGILWRRTKNAIMKKEELKQNTRMRDTRDRGSRESDRCLRRNESTKSDTRDTKTTSEKTTIDSMITGYYIELIKEKLC